ncbi:uncharacterized protein J4E88_010617 [Alternaria novae-zelandiae]|uniref:uncharacterized protein n=1 Tax=Alternaria novae-zelandiae TaxID=430562 RepID=UPI0020C36D8B|nr:uncharacterized protein J4E88_010617 [Alternaria novae-zelandiae]KAI4665169.1 hypothetical protein J4E88_010617 [Alternaria novae-zelandiae]
MATDVKDFASLSAPSDANEITRSNQLNSPLLRLPGEIRNRIYEYTFFDCKMIVKDPHRRGLIYRRNNSPLHVLATCQQIRHEATTIFWNECTIDAASVFPRRELEPAVGSSNCARITSLVVDQGILYQEQYNFTVPISNTLANFPLLSKVRLVYYLPDEEVEAALRCIRAMGIEVECIEPNRTPYY